MSETTTPVLNGPSPASGPPRAVGAWLRSPTGKVCMILGLLLLMQAPLAMVSGLIAERQQRQQDVQAGFTRGWGPDQSLAGPMLFVPYTRSAASGSSLATETAGWMRIAPASLSLSADLKPETHRRGLFHAVVYAASLKLSGAFAPPPPDIEGTVPDKVDWQAARLVLGATDLRGLRDDASFVWQGGTLSLATGTVQNACGLQLISLPAALPPQGPPRGRPIPFKAAFSLRGTQAFHVVPIGRHFDVDMKAPWPTPSFIGDTLPLDYEVGSAGFSAHWELADASMSSGWEAANGAFPDCQTISDAARYRQDALPGVELQEAVPTYLMVSRASKYGILFLTLSYLTLFLFETVSRVRVHMAQYGLLGLSVSLFALLLISTAEPLGFLGGYAVSTACVLLQASLYTLSVVRGTRLAAIFAGVLGALFGFLFIVLSLDAYALLAGTVALFVILSVVMFVTRKVDWSGAPG